MKLSINCIDKLVELILKSKVITAKQISFHFDTSYPKPIMEYPPLKPGKIEPLGSIFDRLVPAPEDMALKHVINELNKGDKLSKIEDLLLEVVNNDNIKELNEVLSYNKYSQNRIIKHGNGYKIINIEELNSEEVIEKLLIFMKEEVEAKGLKPNQVYFNFSKACTQYYFNADSSYIKEGEDLTNLKEILFIDDDSLWKAIKSCKSRGYISDASHWIKSEDFNENYSMCVMLTESGLFQTIASNFLPAKKQEIETNSHQEYAGKPKIRKLCKELIIKKIPEYLKLSQYKEGGFKQELLLSIDKEIKQIYPLNSFTKNIFNDQWDLVIKEKPEYQFLSKKGKRNLKEQA